MKKRTGKIAMLCMSALLFVQAMPVWAAGETEIALNPGKAQEGGQVQVAGEITDGREVTNGKIRIHYDASKLTLTADSAGGALSGALCEVNDCLTGNKEEGEIVAAFASSSPLTEDGSLLDMTFQLADGVKAGDTDPGGDDKDPSGDDNKNPGGDDNKTPGGDKNDGTDSDGNKGTTPTPTPAKNKKSGTTTTSKSAKTGDDTNMVFPLLGAGAAVAVIAAVTAAKKKIES